MKTKLGEWIPGYEDLYKITKRGIVISYHAKTPKELKVKTDKDGVYIITLRKDKVPTTHTLKYLLTLTYPPKNKVKKKPISKVMVEIAPIPEPTPEPTPEPATEPIPAPEPAPVPIPEAAPTSTPRSDRKPLMQVPAPTLAATEDSSTTVLTLTAFDIISSALRKGGIIRPRQDPNADDITTGLEMLNSVFKSWDKDTHLWAQKEVSIPLNVGQAQYLLGTDGAEATLQDDLITTTTTTTAAIATTTIVVESVEGMSGGYINQTTNNFFKDTNWIAEANTTISDVNPILFLQLDSTGSGGGDFNMFTAVGSTYRVTVTIDDITASEVNLNIIDSNDSVLFTQPSVVVATLYTLDFVATTTVTSFNVEIVSATTGQVVEFRTSLPFLLQLQEGSDFIGIELANNIRQWTTIADIDTGTNTLTLVDPLTDSVAAGASVFTYTTQLERPLRMYNPRVQTFPVGQEIPMSMWSRQEYMRQTDKIAAGLPTTAYYSPELTLGKMFLWQTPSSVNQVWNVTCDFSLVVAQQATVVDLPSAWYEYAIWALAYDMAGEYQIPERRLLWITQKKTETQIIAEAFDDQLYGDIQLGPGGDGFDE